jgi:hypothetical protein
MMKERPTKCIFKVNLIFRISILLLHVSALQERHLQGAQKDPDEIVRMLRHKCRISEGRKWIPSTPYLHLFGTCDGAYAQFHQDPLGLPEDGAPAAPKHVGARLIF